MLTEREIETNRICVGNSFCIATCRHNDWSKPNTRDFYDKELDKTLPQKMLCQDFLGKCLFLHHHGMPDTEHVCAVRYAGYETFPCQTSNLSEINMPTSFATIFCLVVFFGSPFPQAVAFCQKKVVALLTSRLWEALGAVATSKPNLPTNWLGRLLLVTPQGALASFLPRGWPRMRIAAWLNKATHPEMRAACSDASEVGQKRLTNPQVFSLQRRFGNATLVGELQGIQGDDMQFFHV